jgi:hypothetical protein
MTIGKAFFETLFLSNIPVRVIIRQTTTIRPKIHHGCNSNYETRISLSSFYFNVAKMSFNFMKI